MGKLDNVHPDSWQLVAELRAENERLRYALGVIMQLSSLEAVRIVAKAALDAAGGDA